MSSNRVPRVYFYFVTQQRVNNRGLIKIRSMIAFQSVQSVETTLGQRILVFSTRTEIQPTNNRAVNKKDGNRSDVSNVVRIWKICTE